MTYTAVGLMGGYVYRNIPLRIECNIWTNFILDPNRPCFAHFALIILILHGFVGFTRYLFHPIEGKGHHIAYRKMKAFGDIIPIIAILYPMPLFLLSLYFNYDYGYGISGLHIAYPLLAILPYLLGEDLSRDMLDFVQVVTGLSAALLSFATGNYFIITAVVTQLFIYHFSHFRGEKYKRGSSTAVYNVAITLSIYLFYNAFTQIAKESEK